MSSNRLMYDTCAYKKNIEQSTSPLSYVLNPSKYENCNKCRHELGLLGGPTASIIKGNLVDLENDLRGQTRTATQCPDKLYHPQCNGVNLGDQCKPGNLTLNSNGCGAPRNLDTELLHLRPCSMIRYKPVHLPEPLKTASCPAPSNEYPRVANCGTGPAAYNA